MRIRFSPSFYLFLIGLMSALAQAQIAETSTGQVYTWAMEQPRPQAQVTGLLLPQSAPKSVAGVVDAAQFFTLQPSALRDLVRQAPASLRWDLPTAEGTVLTLRLYKIQILTDDYQVSTAMPLGAPISQGVHYRGAIEGQPDSWASVSLFEDEIYGLLANREGNWNLGAMEQQPWQYVLYNDQKLKSTNPFHCMTSDAELNGGLYKNQTSDTLETLATCKTVRLFWESDYQLYTSKGSNATTVSNFLTSIFNQMTTLYANDGIRVQLAGTYIWNTADPYPNTSSSDALTAFQNRWNGLSNAFNANFAMLVTLDGHGNGGLAYRGPGYCVTDYSYAYAEISSGFSTVPTYSWTVEVLTHETGHNLGSPHTHACSWNGNNTPIDSCGPTYNTQYTEGSCTVVANPTATVGGTIMSYCHLLSNVGIKFVNGFGPQPQRLIVNAINSASCVTGDSTALAFYTQQINGNVVQFTSSSTNATTLTWNLGNGQTGSGTPISQTYTATGTYRVCLKATNSCGSTQYCKDIVISSLSNPSFEAQHQGHWVQSPDSRELVWNEVLAPGIWILKVYNALGQCMGSKPITSQSVQWDGSGYAPGLYLMELQGESGVIVQKAWLR